MIEFHKLKPIGKMSVHLYTAGESSVEEIRAGTSLKQGLIGNPPIIYKLSRR
jgi:hypothetical protein